MDDVSVCGIDFTVTEEMLGDNLTVELKPGGEQITVSNDNLNECCATPVITVLACADSTATDVSITAPTSTAITVTTATISVLTLRFTCNIPTLHTLLPLRQTWSWCSSTAC
eukprot:19413-Heterococcus_DN1.PRE.3